MLAGCLLPLDINRNFWLLLSLDHSVGYRNTLIQLPDSVQIKKKLEGSTDLQVFMKTTSMMKPLNYLSFTETLLWWQALLAVSNSWLRESPATLLSPSTAFIYANMPTLLPGSVGNETYDWRKRLSVHRMSHPIYLIIEFLCWSHLLISSYLVHWYLHTLCTFGNIYLHNSCPNAFLIDFPSVVCTSEWQPNNTQTLG